MLNFCYYHKFITYHHQHHYNGNKEKGKKKQKKSKRYTQIMYNSVLAEAITTSKTMFSVDT